MTDPKPTEDAADLDLAIAASDDAGETPESEADTLGHESQLDEIARIDGIKIHPRMTMAELEHIYADLLARHDEALKAAWYVAAGRACIKLGQIQGIWLSKALPETDQVITVLNATLADERANAATLNALVSQTKPSDVFH